MANPGGVLQYPLLSRLSDQGRKGGIKILTLHNFSFIWTTMARGAFSLRELVRRADFENSARWCVVSELGAIRFPVVWGDSRGFVPINRGPGRQRGSLDRAS